VEESRQFVNGVSETEVETCGDVTSWNYKQKVRRLEQNHFPIQHNPVRRIKAVLASE